MADFRKCLLAFALVALLASFAGAQTTSALQCTVNASVTPTVRAEGLAELLGDIVLNCTGGTATPFGQAVPQANVVIYTTVPLTSRITANPYTEVFMIFDEPHSASAPTVPILMCDTANAAAGVCSITGTGSGYGTYNPNFIGIAGNAGPRPNVFQARITGTNQVTFFGVPIDPPGTAGTRVIRVTNLRGNANYLNVSSSLVPSTIIANISVSPSNLLPLNNPQQTVAYIAKGLTVSLSAAPTFIQCQDANAGLAGSPSAAIGTGGQNGTQFAVVFNEGFPAAWKEKNIATHLYNGPGVANGYPTDLAQDVPGANYFSETGFLVNGSAPAVVAPTGFGPFEASIPGNVMTTFASYGRGANLAGTATQGTRLLINFDSIPTGTQLFVPFAIALVVPQVSTSVASGVAVLVATDGSGAGAFTAASYSATNSSTLWSGLAPVTLTSGSGIAVYEILYDNPFQNERLTVPVAVAYAANAGNNLPAPGITATVTGNFAPLSTVTTYDTTNTAPIPRFVRYNTALNSYKIVKCSCNLLFPWVAYTGGFDTGVAISNTSSDPFGTTPQTGTVTLSYYTSGTAPAAQTTTSAVPGGSSLVFTLSGGGNFGIAGISNGFSGYLIAQAQFQYCHGYAFISAFGALPTAAGTSEGYLGIELDTPFQLGYTATTTRTGQFGEVQAH